MTLFPRAIDTQALLTANACMGCHAFDKKILGPAFKEVVAKYRGKADAESSVAHNIQSGGAGKWGPVPMPAFDKLGEAEAKALARYVLAQ